MRCEPTNFLFDWTFDSVVNRVTQTPTRISMQIGHMDLARVIHLDQKAVPASVKPSRAGYSIGHWEADTLVVETSAFLPGVLNADGRLLHGARLHITERFRVEADPVRLTRQFVAEDPEYLAEPWRGSGRGVSGGRALRALSLQGSRWRPSAELSVLKRPQRARVTLSPNRHGPGPIKAR